MARVSPREFEEWRAYDAIDPIGDEREDFGFALVAWLTASAFAGKGRRPKLGDFLPNWEKRVRGQTVEEQTAAIMAWVSQVNAAEKRKEKDKGNVGNDRPVGRQAQ